MTDRMDKVDSLIEQKISEILLKNFPDKIITISKVEVTRDLQFAKIWVSELNNTDETIRQIKKERRTIRKELAAIIELRKIPSLVFVPDYSESHAQKIDKLLNDINKKS